MANSPVLELQALASDPDTDIVALLMKAKMIAVKLGLEGVKGWIEHELNGYPTIASAPEYRTGHGQLKAYNPFNGWIPVDLGNISAKIMRKFTTYTLTESIASMIRAEGTKGNIRLPIPLEMAEMLYHNQDSRPETCWFFSSGKCSHIVTTVRNKILDWSLELEKQGIMGEGLLFTQAEKEVAPMTVNNTNIFNGAVNNAGSIGAGNTGDINQNNSITVGDFNSLEKQLKEWGVSEADITTLHQAIQESPVPTTMDNLGGKLGGWLGDMIGKAYAGTLNIAASAAPALLTNAICHYYNIPV